MQDYVLRNWSIVRTGTTSAQKSLFFNLRRLKAKISGGNIDKNLDEVSYKKIANDLGVSMRDVHDMDMRLSGSDKSLNAPVSADQETDLQSIMPSNAPNPEDVIIGMKDRESRSRWLNEALSTMSVREQQIIKERHLSYEPITLEELGKSMGVSKERVRQLEARAMSRLKSVMATHVQTPTDLFIEN